MRQNVLAGNTCSRAMKRFTENTKNTPVKLTLPSDRHLAPEVRCDETCPRPRPTLHTALIPNDTAVVEDNIICLKAIVRRGRNLHSRTADESSQKAFGLALEHLQEGRRQFHALACVYRSPLEFI